LHIACGFSEDSWWAIGTHQDIEVIELILAAYPAATAEHYFGLHPLHIATYRGLPASVIRSLVDAYPAAVAIKDELWEQYPLHLSISRSNYVETILALIEVYPAGAAGRDNDGAYPLHLAADNFLVSVQVVSALVDAFPEAASRANNKGALPLHLAAAGTVFNESLLVILNAYPAAATIPNAEGLFPLQQVAKSSHPTVGVLRSLIDAFPLAVDQRDKEGNYALDYFLMNWATAFMLYKKEINLLVLHGAKLRTDQVFHLSHYCVFRKIITFH